MTAEIITYQADHPLLLAVPAFAPAIVVAGVVAYIAIRDRRRKDPPKDQRPGRETGFTVNAGALQAKMIHRDEP